MPFQYGDYWYCPQGQNSTFSHNGKLAYGIDFNQDTGPYSEENEAFGENLFSPVNGEIVEIRHGLIDFYNNSSNNDTNNWGWGNTIVILDEGGDYYIRLAHLKYLSTSHLMEGDEVKMGDYLGQVGQTGFSTGPHLHIQVMRKTQDWNDIINEWSFPFTFAEGKIYTGDWIKSGLSYNMSMLDNNGEVTLSHFFNDYYTYYNSTQWQTRYGTYGYAGKDFRRHYVSSSNDNSMFSWHFSVKQSSLYMLFVTFEDNAANDTKVEYYLDGQKIKTLTQKVGGQFYKYIGIRYISAGVQHTISVRGTTPGKYVIADALVLRKYG